MRCLQEVGYSNNINSFFFCFTNLQLIMIIHELVCCMHVAVHMQLSIGSGVIICMCIFRLNNWFPGKWIHATYMQLAGILLRSYCYNCKLNSLHAIAAVQGINLKSRIMYSISFKAVWVFIFMISISQTCSAFQCSWRYHSHQYQHHHHHYNQHLPQDSLFSNCHPTFYFWQCFRRESINHV